MACLRASKKSIEALCGVGNATGLRNVLYGLPRASVTTIPALTAGKHEITTDFTLVAAEKWEQLFMDGKGKYNSGKTEGGAFMPTVEGVIPRLDATSTDVLMKWRGWDNVYLFTDNNGKTRFLENCELMFEETTEGTNGYKVTLKAISEQPDPPKFYAGIIPLV
jgi:hypothetical protein